MISSSSDQELSPIAADCNAIKIFGQSGDCTALFSAASQSADFACCDLHLPDLVVMPIRDKQCCPVPAECEATWTIKLCCPCSVCTARYSGASQSADGAGCHLHLPDLVAARVADIQGCPVRAQGSASWMVKLCCCPCSVGAALFSAASQSADGACCHLHLPNLVVAVV